jgi:hypothetical protein
MPFLTLSSTNRTSGTDDDFQIISNQSIAGFRKVRLSKAVMTNSLYNVNTNNFFKFQIADDANGTNSSSVLTATISSGNYSISGMLTALGTAIGNALIAAGIPQTVTVTTLPITRKLSIQIGGGKFIRSTPDDGLGLNLQLGFSRTSESVFGSPLESPRIYNMTKYNSLYVYSSIIFSRSFNSNSNQKGALLDMLPIASSNFGDILTYTPPNNEWLNISESSIGDIQIQVKDDQNNAVDLNGGFITLILEIA